MGAQKVDVLNKSLHARLAYSSGAMFISTAVYQWWEIRQYLLETETPGRFGYFNAEAAA